MPVDTNSKIDYDTIDYKGYGQSSFVPYYPTTAPVLAHTSVSKASITISASVFSPATSRLRHLILTTAVSAAANMPVFHVGYLSYIQSCRLLQVQGGSVLYEQQNADALSKLRNRLAYSKAEIGTRPKLLPVSGVAGALPTSDVVKSVSVAGGTLFLANSASVIPVDLATTCSAAVPSVIPIVETLSTALPVANLCFSWSTIAGAVPVVAEVKMGFIIDQPLRDLGGFFSLDKYTPFMSDLRLELTFNPTTYWMFETDTYLLATPRQQPAAQMPIMTELVLNVDTASRAVTSQLMDVLSQGDIRIKVPVLYETVVNTGGAGTFTTSVPVSGFMGERVRKIFFATCDVDGADVYRLNMNNKGGHKWLTVRTSWNTNTLQQSPVNYYEAFDYLGPVIKNGSYANAKEYLANCVWVDDFTGSEASDLSLVNADIGMSIDNTNNNYYITLTQTVLAEGRTLYIYVECQRTLVLTKFGASIV